MDAVIGDVSKLTLADNNGNRIQLINNIQKDVRSVIDNLVSQCDTLAAKNEIIATLERVCHGLDSIKASLFKEEGNVSCDLEMTFIGTNFADQQFSSSLKIAFSFFFLSLSNHDNTTEATRTS